MSSIDLILGPRVGVLPLGYTSIRVLIGTWQSPWPARSCCILLWCILKRSSPSVCFWSWARGARTNYTWIGGFFSTISTRDPSILASESQVQRHLQVLPAILHHPTSYHGYYEEGVSGSLHSCYGKCPWKGHIYWSSTIPCC